MTLDVDGETGTSTHFQTSGDGDTTQPQRGEAAYEAPSRAEVLLGSLNGDYDEDGVDDWRQDTDKDGISNEHELLLYKTNPHDADTDGDGLRDDAELAVGTDPSNPDTDSDGRSDGEEVFGRAEDELSDIPLVYSDPLKADTDGTADVFEHSDTDGISDYAERLRGTNPYDEDTDGDGIRDDQDANPTTPDVVREPAQDQYTPEWFERNKANLEDLTKPEAPPSDHEGELASPDGVIRVTDPELAKKAGYADVDGRVGQFDFVWNKRTGEMEEGDKLPRAQPSTTVAATAGRRPRRRRTSSATKWYPSTEKDLPLVENGNPTSPATVSVSPMGCPLGVTLPATCRR